MKVKTPNLERHTKINKAAITDPTTIQTNMNVSQYEEALCIAAPHDPGAGSPLTLFNSS
jgi:hypothetical protein